MLLTVISIIVIVIVILLLCIEWCYSVLLTLCTARLHLVHTGCHTFYHTFVPFRIDFGYVRSFDFRFCSGAIYLVPRLRWFRLFPRSPFSVRCHVHTFTDFVRLLIFFVCSRCSFVYVPDFRLFRCGSLIYPLTTFDSHVTFVCSRSVRCSFVDLICYDFTFISRYVWFVRCSLLRWSIRYVRSRLHRFRLLLLFDLIVCCWWSRFVTFTVVTTCTHHTHTPAWLHLSTFGFGSTFLVLISFVLHTYILFRLICSSVLRCYIRSTPRSLIRFWFTFSPHVYVWIYIYLYVC